METLTWESKGKASSLIKYIDGEPNRYLLGGIPFGSGNLTSVKSI